MKSFTLVGQIGLGALMGFALTPRHAVAALPTSPVGATCSADSSAKESPVFPGKEFDFHGYAGHEFSVDGCSARVAEPKSPLPGNPWIWRTAFWDAFAQADIALLNRGFTVAYIDGGDTWGCPDAMKHFDAFYALMTTTYGLSRRPALEGLSRGGLYAYRWASENADRVSCIYGDAPLCDLKSLRGPAPYNAVRLSLWNDAVRDYHFASDQQMVDYKGNPVDTLAPLAAAHVPIIHVCGDADPDVPKSENNDIIHDRYTQMGGTMVVFVKQGCAHHPHSLADPTPVVEFIVAYAATGQAAEDAMKVAPKAGTVTVLPQGKW